jgi:hypothetical protein
MERPAPPKKNRRREKFSSARSGSKGRDESRLKHVRVQMQAEAKAPWHRLYLDILLSLKGEDSYGVRVGFTPNSSGGFLPQPLYSSGGQRRGFTFGQSGHRSFDVRSIEQPQGKRKGLISSA